MELDCNLKKLANSIRKILSCVLEKSLKSDVVCSLCEALRLVCVRAKVLGQRHLVKHLIELVVFISLSFNKSLSNSPLAESRGSISWLVRSGSVFASLFSTLVLLVKKNKTQINNIA